jgi:ABC-2 type transport system ATP-binding protein
MQLCNDERWNIIDRGTPDDLIKKHGRKNLEEVFLELVRK